MAGVHISVGQEADLIDAISVANASRRGDDDAEFWTPDRDELLRFTVGDQRLIATLAKVLGVQRHIVQARWHVLRVL